VDGRSGAGGDRRQQALGVFVEQAFLLHTLDAQYADGLFSDLTGTRGRRAILLPRASCRAGPGVPGCPY
jgi:hypothetical protein